MFYYIFCCTILILIDKGIIMLKKAISSWLNGYKKIFCYSGRATRSEYGFFLLLQFIFMIAACIFFASVFGSAGDAIAYLLAILFILTTLSYSVRRLHDGNFTGWYCLAYLLIGPFLLGVIATIPPKYGTNKYGDDPRQISK